MRLRTDKEYMYGIDERSTDVLSNTSQMSRNEGFWTYDTKQSTSANFETHNCNCCLIVTFSKPRSRPNAYTKFHVKHTLPSLLRVLSLSRLLLCCAFRVAILGFNFSCSLSAVLNRARHSGPDFFIWIRFQF